MIHRIAHHTAIGKGSEKSSSSVRLRRSNPAHGSPIFRTFCPVAYNIHEPIDPSRLFQPTLENKRLLPFVLHVRGGLLILSVLPLIS